MGQLAVVGEQQQALGLGVEPAHVEQAWRQLLDVVGQAWAALRVVHRGDDADGLVQRVVDQVGGGRDALAVHVDDLRRRVDLGAEPPDDLAVHRDTALADHLLAGPAAGHARLGEHLLQAHAARDLGGVALVGVALGVEVAVADRLPGGLHPVVLRAAVARLPAATPGASADGLDVVAARGPGCAGALAVIAVAPAVTGTRRARRRPGRGLLTTPAPPGPEPTGPVVAALLVTPVVAPVVTPVVTALGTVTAAPIVATGGALITLATPVPLLADGTLTTPVALLADGTLTTSEAVIASGTVTTSAETVIASGTVATATEAVITGRSVTAAAEAVIAAAESIVAVATTATEPVIAAVALVAAIAAVTRFASAAVTAVTIGTTVTTVGAGATVGPLGAVATVGAGAEAVIAAEPVITAGSLFAAEPVFAAGTARVLAVAPAAVPGAGTAPVGAQGVAAAGAVAGAVSGAVSGAALAAGAAAAEIVVVAAETAAGVVGAEGGTPTTAGAARASTTASITGRGATPVDHFVVSSRFSTSSGRKGASSGSSLRSRSPRRSRKYELVR
ncbi:hypothetical protein GCM10020220_014730 [Nonomuraea rubra]